VANQFKTKINLDLIVMNGSFNQVTSERQVAKQFKTKIYLDLIVMNGWWAVSGGTAIPKQPLTEHGASSVTRSRLKNQLTY